MDLCKHIDYEVLAIANILIANDHVVPFWHIC